MYCYVRTFFVISHALNINWAKLLAKGQANTYKNFSNYSCSIILISFVGSIVSEVKVKVMSTDAQWFGVTYPQDKEAVTNKITQYKEDDLYPFDLWSIE